MDLISHGLWGGLVMGRRKGYWWAALFGMLPDILAFGPYLILRAVQGGILNILTPPQAYPQWVYTMYNSSHSLVIAGVVFVSLSFICRDTALLFLAWPLHILMDIPTHSAANFPTKFLFPLSHLYYDGTHWRNGYILLGNWAAITLAYTVYSFYKRRAAARPGF